MNRTFFQVAVVSTVFLVSLAGCSRQTTSGGKITLLCYAEGTFAPPAEKAAKLFEKKTGVHVDFDYADCGELLVKVETTRKGDVFFGHDPFYAVLQKKGLIDEVWNVARLTPAIAVPKGNPKKITGLKDLAKPGLRIGITSEEYSTLGHLYSIMFRKAQCEKAIRKNIVTVTRMGGEVANSVALGHLDAAIVWRPVIALRKDKLDAVAIEKAFLPQPDVDSVTTATFGKIDMSKTLIWAGPLTCSQHPKEAKAFAAFLGTPEARRIFIEEGYDAP